MVAFLRIALFLQLAVNTFGLLRMKHRCDETCYRALLFGGMRETEAKEIELLDCPVAAFRLLLRYIYSGKLSLSTFKEDLVLDLLGLSNKFGFSDLENSISDYLKVPLECLQCLH
jgi:hypothetical protein